MMTQVSTVEARANLAELLGRAQDHHERIILTSHGKPVAVIVGIDDFESIMETLDVLGSPQTMADLKEAQADIAAGRVYRVEPGMTLPDFLKAADEADDRAANSR